MLWFDDPEKNDDASNDTVGDDDITENDEDDHNCDDSNDIDVDDDEDGVTSRVLPRALEKIVLMTHDEKQKQDNCTKSWSTPAH